MPPVTTIKTERTLYISDLDGTLLHHNERISARSCDIINGLIDKGMLFSFATARSMITASVVSQGLRINLPVIVNNGTFLVDSNTKERLVVNHFSAQEAADIYYTLRRYDIMPFVYAIIDNAERFSYIQGMLNPAQELFVDSRKNDGRDHPLPNDSTILDGTVFGYTCIGEESKLLAAHKELKEHYNCIYQYDIYSNEPWLEIQPHAATKANAILQLKKMYSCDKVVVFGDGANDLPMFYAADQCYAVANALDELKAVATDIIDSNEADGVARWLLSFGCLCNIKQK